mgnify:CR=1 FL=1|tara:strand:+ start:1915 stop:2130 length:216 start_codon:yes stop_codon:yes gene_type:complete
MMEKNIEKRIKELGAGQYIVQRKNKGTPVEVSYFLNHELYRESYDGEASGSTFLYEVHLIDDDITLTEWPL